ncbi:MerR family transcriptional regulator [Lentiprolixibacter aurantiacus]|uniref:MerR family transcriptional regulator n=1 Tax=Lentiprolixibacter aurantiacus TaxID=2993939 RepID=A0AAE3SMN0_9FLAO|nr:MerR family transcriptional regulator [Lentiprolixibacter aurantiacus]MCX2718754.1 MerR family transcriptional regulator [Lentiprolixibacter aurantiacus]
MANKLTRLQWAEILTDSGWFDHHFLFNFIPKGGKIREFLNEKRYKLSDEKVTSRVLNHWNEIGILEDDRPEGKGWRRFSISEMVWITIIKKLRRFGLDMNAIKKVNEYLKSYNSEKVLSKYLILDFYLAYGRMFKEPIKLIVFADGESLLCRQEALNQFHEDGNLKDDYICIDVISLFSKGTGFPNQTEYTSTKIEKELKESLKLSDLKELKVTVRGKKYIVEKERLMKDKRTAEALFNMIDFGVRTDTKYDSRTAYKITETKKIDKEGETLK